MRSLRRRLEQLEGQTEKPVEDSDWYQRYLWMQRHYFPVLKNYRREQEGLERYMGLRPIRCKLVRGTSRTTQHKLYYWTVPRSYMFSMLDGSFSSDRIIIDPQLGLAKELIDELKNLQLEQDQETGNIRVTHRKGQHDDLSICLAAANWWASEPRPKNTLRLLW